MPRVRAAAALSALFGLGGFAALRAPAGAARAAVDPRAPDAASPPATNGAPAPPRHALAAAADSPLPAPAPPAAWAPDAPDRYAGLASAAVPKVVLVAGDSMVGFRCCLSQALEGRFRAEGARLVPDAWNNVQTATYDHAARLPDLLRRVNPDLVLVSLGTNDVFVPHPEALAANVRSIARKIAPRACYWIGPPTWTKDTGIVEVLRKNAAPCRFFDSSGLPLERLKDGVHVTDAGGAAWAGHFWRAFRGAPDGG